MTRFLSALLFALALALPAEAQDADIQAVITNQMEAFKADDFDTAFTYAAPNIKRMFGTADRFGMMVRQGYPMVHRPADVEYLELEDRGGVLWQRVQVQDAQGAFHYLAYMMIETPDGWQIAAVQTLPAPDVAA